jgi:hypothetical protein
MFGSAADAQDRVALNDDGARNRQWLMEEAKVLAAR